jgi:hypothetical protein
LHAAILASEASFLVLLFGLMMEMQTVAGRLA